MVAASLRPMQDEAKALDRNKQMLVAASLLSYGGYFQMEDSNGKIIPAKAQANGLLVPGTKLDIATEEQMKAVYDKRIKPLLTNAKGNIKTFKELGIKEEEYLHKNAKGGYYGLKWKLVYEIKPNKEVSSGSKNLGVGAYGYIIPVNGFGLWSAIYGYVAVGSGANVILGSTWYQQEETAGLGAEIATEWHQTEFIGKHIFQESANGKTNFSIAPLGITVVKGKMSDQFAKTSKAKSSVDGISGATLTGNGVTAAYSACLKPYRAFLIKMHNANAKGK